jgi:hypothetical protein
MVTVPRLLTPLALVACASASDAREASVTLEPPAVAGERRVETPPAPEAAGWPVDPSARWPRACLVENLGVHPTEPWLTLPCTRDADFGSLLVFDVERLVLRTSTPVEQGAGWAGDLRVVRWHADGKRLACNVATHGIALFERGVLVGTAYPDDGRDHAVDFLWVDDRVLADTGAFFTIEPGERFAFTPLKVPAWGDFEWNAKLGAAVGATARGLAAYDPVKEKLLYERETDATGALSSPSFSPDGRAVAYRTRPTPPQPEEIQVFDADDGTLRETLRPSAPFIGALAWGPDGKLAVSSYRYDRRGGGKFDHHVDLFGAPARQTVALGLRKAQAENFVDEAAAIAWSPDGSEVALLIDGVDLRIVGVARGETRHAFAAPAPPVPSGLPSFYCDESRSSLGCTGGVLWVGRHLVRLAPHFVSVWSVDGKKLGEWIVPDS